MSTPTPEDINAAIDAALEPIAERQVQTFSSGAVSISIRIHGRTAVIDGTSDGQWGVSVDPDEGAAMTGHDTVTASFPAALDIARRRLAS